MCTVAADAAGFDDGAVHGKTCGSGLSIKGTGGFLGVEFFRGAALAADHEDRRMGMGGVATRNIGIQALDLVGKANVLEEFKRAVDGWRFCRACTIELAEQVVCLGRLGAFDQKPKHFSAERRHALAAALDQCLCFGEKRIGVFRTAGRIHVVMGHGRNVVCFDRQEKPNRVRSRNRRR